MRTSYIQWDDDDVPFVLNYSTNSMEQQSAGRPFFPLSS